MSIADQITELTTIRGDIRTALAGKGVSASDHNFADFASDIDAIPSGGGGGLPSEYQEVDYVTSTGTQRIETGLVNDTLGVPLSYDMLINYPSDVSTRQLNGSQGGWYVGVVNGKWQIGTSSTNNTGKDAVANKWYRVYVSFTGVSDSTANAIGSFVNKDTGAGSQWASASSGSQGVATNVSSSFMVCLFAMNSQNLPSSCSIGETKISRSGEIVRHFIPCYRKADKVIGMYDLINNQFYTNAGTGDFTCYPAPPA